MESLHQVWFNNLSDPFGDAFGIRTPEQPLPTFNIPFSSIRNTYFPEQFNVGIRRYLPRELQIPPSRNANLVLNHFADAIIITTLSSPEQPLPTYNNPFSGIRITYFPEQFNDAFVPIRSYFSNNAFLGIRSNFSGQFNNAFVGIRSYLSREQQIPPSRNANLVLNFLQAMSQGQETSSMESLRHVWTNNLSDQFADAFVSFRTFFSPEQPLPTFNNPFSGIRTTYFPEQFNDAFVPIRSYLSGQFNSAFIGIRSYFSGQFNNAFVGIRSYLSRQHQIPPSRNANLVFISTALLNFLQLMSRGQETSPFQTHPKTFNIAITSLLLYGMAYDADQRFSMTHPSSVCVNIARRGMAIFGSLLLASLGSVFLPHKIQPLLYVMYVFVYADELQSWLQRRVVVVELPEIENVRLPI